MCGRRYARARIESAAGVAAGVGAFRVHGEPAHHGLIDSVRRVIERDTVLGICLGMQLLFEEASSARCAGSEFSRPRRTSPARAEVPHMGWNRAFVSGRTCRTCAILTTAPSSLRALVYVVPADASLTATSTDYGIEFTSAIARDHVFATQYHQKSQAVGLKILENFGRLVSGK
jgi:glutamine amidotransferase